MMLKKREFLSLWALVGLMPHVHEWSTVLSLHVYGTMEEETAVTTKLYAASQCYTEKATQARHRLERQYNACENRKKQCRPNETKRNQTPTRYTLAKHMGLVCKSGRDDVGHPIALHACVSCQPVGLPEYVRDTKVSQK